MFYFRCIFYTLYTNTGKMIQELTKENLQKCGFDNEDINKLIKLDKQQVYLFKDTCYFASNIENKIYTEIDGFRKYYFENDKISFPYYCPDLIPDYFDLVMSDYLEKQKKLLNKMFVEADQKKDFITHEIRILNNTIKENLNKKYYIFFRKENDVLKSYVRFLEAITPQQPETNITEEVLLKNEYITIFKNDIGFTLFTKMFELYKTENTDLANFSFLFYAMEKDFLVCSQTDFIKFLENDKYDVSIEKIDSRQSGENKKSKLYNSIKETLQKKHEKSTI